MTNCLPSALALTPSVSFPLKQQRARTSQEELQKELEREALEREAEAASERVYEI